MDTTRKQAIIMTKDRFVSNSSLELKKSNCSPISGYEDSCLLTLEEAVEKLTLLMADIIRYVKIAKKKCYRTSTFLTRDEAAGIYLYTMPIPFYTHLNAALRNENRDELKPWFAFLKLFLTALAKLPSVKSKVWRGVNYDSTLAFFDDDVYTWWSVTSCSKTLDVVQIYVGEAGSLFSIDTTDAKDISAFSARPDEEEVILMPGTQVRCKPGSFNYQNRLVIRHLEQISLQSEPDYLFQLIKQEYQQNSRIERIINPAKSFPIKESYVNLAMVTATEQREKEKQLHEAAHQPDAIISSFEEIYETKTRIDVHDIFKTCHNQRRQVLVFGRAGIGKSIFCKYVAYLWATGAYWSEYELLVLVPLRRLTSNRYPVLPPGQSYSLIDLVKKEVFSIDLSEQQDRLLTAQFDAQRTLWILDGYDEVIQNVPAHLECLLERLLKTPNHILTSRPYLNTLAYDVQMEITGFTDENIESYVQKFFDQMKDDSDNNIIKKRTLLKYLQSNRSIWGVAHIPVNLELICSVWSNEDSLERKDLTITSLYRTMTEWLCRRYLTITLNQRILHVSANEINQQCEKELAFLEMLAFHAMESNTIIIRPSLLEKASVETKFRSQADLHALNLGVLKSFNKQGVGTQIETQKDHYFIHLSFQEYFAARHLIHILKSHSPAKAIECITYQKYNQRYTLVFIFMSGIVAENDLRSCSTLFWNAILKEPVDLVGIRHMELVISCLEASFNKAIPHQHDQLLQGILNCLRHSFDRGNRTIRKHLSRSLQAAPSVACDDKIINMLINRLQFGDMNIKSEILIFISELLMSNPSTQLITSIGEAVQSEDKDVRVRACFALASMGDKAATNEVTSQLFSALAHKDHNLRASAAYALGVISERTATNEIIEKLVNALEDEQENVRASASYALGRLNIKRTTSEIIDKLVGALEHSNKHVRARIRSFFGNLAEKLAIDEMDKLTTKLLKAFETENEMIRAEVVYLLGKINQDAVTVEVFDVLTRALTDKNADVRSNAVEALGNMPEKLTRNEIVDKLVCALVDENGSVRRSAWMALENIADEVQANKATRKVISALESDNDHERWIACEAIGMIGKRIETNEVRRKLGNALKDKNEKIRMSACKALAMMCVTATTNEITTSLINTLRDENEKVRVSACQSLAMIGKKEITGELVSSLVNALEDQSTNVRVNALYVLGKMGQQVATDEVIKKVVSLLRDEDRNIRSNACCTLADFGGIIMNNETIRELRHVLSDNDRDVRAGACKALANLGDITKRDEVTEMLATSLNDVSGHVRYNACEALQSLNGTRVTERLVRDLIDRVNDDHFVVSQRAAQTLSKIVTSSFLSRQLDLQLISNLCLTKHGTVCSQNISIVHLIDEYFTGQKSECLSQLYLLALVHRIAVTIDKDRLVIYDTKEPHEIVVLDSQLRQKLADTFTVEAKQLYLELRTSSTI